MRKIGVFVFAGVIAAMFGMFIADMTGDFFNGMDYGSAAVLGMCMYLCVVVVTCTGIIVSKLEEKKQAENPEETKNP